MNTTATDQPFFFTTSTMAGGDNTAVRPRTAAASQASGGEDLVQRARREISEILREVALLSRQAIDRERFFAALIDRIVCAIAAEGAVLWDCSFDPPQVVSRTGRVTDVSIAPSCIATHTRLLHEIASLQSPAVVPSTPDATDPSLPANPSAFPVAVVPVIDLAHADNHATEPSSQSSMGPRYVLEVFLEAEAGVATQRGYLRFVVQMADLASEFLRNDEIRRSRANAALQSQMMASLTQLQSLRTSAAVAAQFVDDAAEMFAVSRVTLASISSRAQTRRARLLAISHIDSLDARGAACRELSERIASLELPPQRQACFDWNDRSELDSAANSSSAALPTDAPLHVVGLIVNQEDSLRLLLQDAVPKSREAEQLSALSQWAQQAFSIYESRRRFESVPLAKAYLALTPALLAVSPSVGRRMVTFLAAGAMFAILAWIPTPMMVSVPATLRPAGIQTHYAPSDVVIESIAVSHGQMVKPGDLLLTLRDWTLEEQIATLRARRGVITQRLARSLASLVQAPEKSAFARGSHDAASDEDLVQQQRLLEEELAGIDEQLELLNAARDRLVIRARCEGHVDAWQAELNANGRPVRRGDALIRVEPMDSPWMVDAQVPQSRLSLVMDRLQQAPEARVKVSTIARPDQSFQAVFVRREQVVAPSREPDWLATSSSEAMLGIELQVRSPGTDEIAVSSEDWTWGTPATATIDCGRMPLAQVVFFDLLRAARRAWSRWI